jgi:acetyl-CoA carboxylase, biotin carboxylase subunit
MEMNARLQVEHGVKEMITGTDLVSAQLDVAAGRGLSWNQENIRQVGHAVECRINAEDPCTGAPCPGRVEQFAVPTGPGIRIDSDLAAGSVVSVWYDSLVAKVLAHAETREKARQRMLRALDELSLDGIVTNVSAQRRHILTDEFVRARV